MCSCTGHPSHEILSPRREGDDTIFRALDPGYQAFREETVHSDTDRAWGQIDERTDRIDGQRPFVQQGFPARQNPRGGVQSGQYQRMRILFGRANIGLSPKKKQTQNYKLQF
jgi:hypothetical protein